MDKSKRQLDLMVAMLVMVSAVVGCGQGALSTGKVSGKVTLRGKPITQGKVTFLPEKGPVASGELGSGGVYTLVTYQSGDGAIIGNCSISITPPTQAAPLPGVNIPPPPPPRPEVTIPKKYHRFDTSGLKRKVESTDNVFDFELAE